MSRRGADWLGVREAREAILAEVRTLGAVSARLADARGWVLAEPIVSPVDLPPWDNSAMDGFAARSADVLGASSDRPRSLRLVGEVVAGSLPTRSVGEGEAIRITTGAPVPPGAECVVRVEHTALDEAPNGTTVLVHSDVDQARNVRPRGEDVRAGAPVLAAGMVLTPACIGVAASVGAGVVSVVRRPRVAVLSTGDELVGLDGFDEVRAGRKIVSSNDHTLSALLHADGFEVVLLGTAADTIESLHERLAGAEGCDALITTGGVSVGHRDLVAEALEAYGVSRHFWRVRARPGSALAFGTLGGLGEIPWFGLPGNPVSTAVAYEVFVRPALLRMAGHRKLYPAVIGVRVPDSLRVRGDATHFVRIALRWDTPDGVPLAHPTRTQSSGALTSIAEADALLVVEGDRPSGPGSIAPALPLGATPVREEPGY